jgi:hypothetical protein
MPSIPTFKPFKPQASLIGQAPPKLKGKVCQWLSLVHTRWKTCAEGQIIRWRVWLQQKRHCQYV